MHVAKRRIASKTELTTRILPVLAPNAATFEESDPWQPSSSLHSIACGIPDLVSLGEEENEYTFAAALNVLSQLPYW